MKGPGIENVSSSGDNGKGWTETENLSGILVQVDAIGDATIRPMRSPVLRQFRLDQSPPPEHPEQP